MRSPPIFQYFGLTIILANQSRFDKVRLLSGAGVSEHFHNSCLRPFTNAGMCDVRTVDCTDDILPGTKCILLLGEGARSDNTGLSLNQIRGNLTTSRWGDYPTIVSYLPQDCCDMQNYERANNPLAYDSIDEKADTSIGAEKSSTKGSTARENYRFWLQADTRKAIRICLNGGVVPSLYEREPEFLLNRPEDELCDVLLSSRGLDLVLDLETTGNLDIRAFAFSLAQRDSLPDAIYGVTTIRHDWTRRYSNYHRILRALAVACSRNRVITHNGQRFDLPLLLGKYRFPLGKDLYDTLIAQQRCYPTVEKSLGHCISLWTYERYHKQDGVFCPANEIQEQQLLVYCCRDVWTTGLVYREIERYANARAGLRASIDQAMASIRPYLLASFTGIEVAVEATQAKLRENDRLLMQYLRIIKLLVGHEMIPSSNKQMVTYFHEELNYPVVSTSSETGKPSLAKNALLRLAMRNPHNPVIQLAIAYRSLQTETGRLAKMVLGKAL